MNQNLSGKVKPHPGKPEIEIDDLSIVQTPEYAMVTFTQKYKSNSINDIGKKVLYLRKDSFYSWKIVSEVWRKIPNQEMDKVAFRPSMRFFDNNEEQKKENN